MNVNVGDRVRFLNDIGGGVVTRILNNDMVSVMTEDGFEIPSKSNQLVVIEDEDNGSGVKTENKTGNVDEIISSYNYAEREDIFFSDNNLLSDNNSEITVCLAFVAVTSSNITDCDLDVYLVNDSDYEILYNISSKREQLYKSVDSGTAEPDTKVFISHYKRQNISEISTFLIHLLFYKKNLYEPLNPFSKAIRINPAKFYKESNFEDNIYFENKAVLLSVYSEDLGNEVASLSNEEIKEIIKEKELSKSVNSPSQVNKKIKEIEIVEVDLHIPQLIDDYKNMSNSEIIDIQMNHFHRELENAISNHIRKIVFIHGVGSGTLKTEIRKSLDREYPVLRYQDASFKEYGYGATLVIIHS